MKNKCKLFLVFLISGLVLTFSGSYITHCFSNDFTVVQASKRHKSYMRHPISWRKSSETKPYPNLHKVKHLWIRVSLNKNRTYIMSGKHIIYTMYSSGGVYKKINGQRQSLTPTGTYHIQPERGTYFYNAGVGEGAHYYVSWKGNGVYLFHSVPTHQNGKYIVSNADKLGKDVASHGCIHLSIADSKWLYENVPVGTKVIIKQD